MERTLLSLMNISTKVGSLLFTSLQELSERILETRYKHSFSVIGWGCTGNQWISLVNWRGSCIQGDGLVRITQVT